MRVQNKNKSSQTTRTRIKEAFVEMMHEKKKIDSISVSELVKRIGINRTTFYTHYGDLYAVAADIETDVSREALQMDIRTKEDVAQYIRFMCANFYRHKEMYSLLLSSRESLHYLSRLKREVYEKLLVVYRTYLKDPLTDFRLEIFTSGMSDQLIQYFRNKSRYDFEELKNNLVRCAMEIFDREE